MAGILQKLAQGYQMGVKISLKGCALLQCGKLPTGASTAKVGADPQPPPQRHRGSPKTSGH